MNYYDEIKNILVDNAIGRKVREYKSNQKDLESYLNRAVIFKQEVPSTGEEVEVERYKKGANLEIGFSYKL